MDICFSIWAVKTPHKMFLVGENQLAKYEEIKKGKDLERKETREKKREVKGIK